LKFEAFIKEVNEKGKGVVQLRYLGGAPKVMPTFDVGKNLKDGVIDIMSGPNAFYTNVFPEADALKLAEIDMAAVRAGPAYAYIQKLYNEKMNAHWLARVVQFDEFYIYLNKEVKKPDFTGLKIRVTPIYRAMVEKLGGTAITSPPSEVYTMMERGTVDGYGWPVRGLFDFSWQKVTKYRLDPGFYNGDIGYMVNLTVWNRLTPAQRKILEDVSMAQEAKAHEDRALNAAERKKHEEAGIKVLRFSAEDEKKYLQLANDAAWESVFKQSPQHGARLRELLTRR
jgi:TRAP-type C4-dicarboxylate transport system substrate-binding protein